MLSILRISHNRLLRVCMFMLFLTIILFTSIQVHAQDNIWTFEYKGGGAQKFEAPSTGRYLIKLHGASGGGKLYSNYTGTLSGHQMSGWTYGGNGGYIQGYIDLQAGETIYICLGEEGSRYTGGYNGGGDSDTGYGGGGCSSITTIDRGELKNFTGHTNEILFVSGGGGGLYDWDEGDSFIGGEAGNYPLANYILGQGIKGTGKLGGGGGGYKGGHLYNDVSTNGMGGNYYINNSKIYNTTLYDDGHRGNGDCTIELVEAINPKIIINLGKAGTINNSNVYEEDNLSIGQSFTIPTVNINTGYSIKGWRKWTSSGWQNCGSTVNAIAGTLVIEPIYQAPLDMDYSIKGSTLWINWAQEDSIDKEYIVQESIDGTNFYDIMSGAYGSNQPPQPKTYGASTGIQVYDVSLTGTYKIEAWGGQGGPDQAASGGYGAYTVGTFKLNRGDKLYIGVGGLGLMDGTPGYNGGGKGFSSGGGGGASHVSLNVNRGTIGNYNGYTSSLLMVAGGGGGASNQMPGGPGGGAGSGNGGYFGVGRDSPIGWHEGSDGGDGGGGGGGYYGGYYGFDKARSSTGGSSYIKSTATNSSHIPGNRYGAGQVIITPLDVIQPVDGNRANYSVYDRRAPEIPKNIRLTSELINIDTIRWDVSADFGNNAWYRVSSYRKDNGALLDRTQALKIESISGTKGYHYYIDRNATGIVTKNNTFTSNTRIDPDKSVYTQYLHIAAVDYAGNISGTAHFKIRPSFSITYDLDGGHYKEGETNPTIYSEDSDDITLNNPEQDGYIFIGWTGSNGDEPQDEVTIPSGSIGNKTYKANWAQENPFVTNFSLDGNKYKFNSTTYYVKQSDVFNIKFSSYIKNKAGLVIGSPLYTPTDNYIQIRNKDLDYIQNLNIQLDMNKFNSDEFEMLKNEENILKVDSVNNTRTKGIFGDIEGYHYLNTEAKSHLDNHLDKVNIYPKTSVITDKYNNSSKDFDNDKIMTIIADGEAPDIEDNIIDDGVYRDGRLPIKVKATDDNNESGIKQLKVEIENIDTGFKETIFNKNNVTYVEETEFEYVNSLGTKGLILKDNENYVGEIKVVITAIDNVGNESKIEKTVFVISLESVVKRMLPIIDNKGNIINDNKFKNGEQGELIIRTTGFVDQLDIKFEGKIRKLANEQGYEYGENVIIKLPNNGENKNYNIRTSPYTDPDTLKSRRADEYFFYIPKDTYESDEDDNTYYIMIVAHKKHKEITNILDIGLIGDKVITDTELEVEGKIESEIRTRIRER